jgi:hypothetical protein
MRRTLGSTGIAATVVRVDGVRLLHLHDPERVGFDASMAPGGSVDELETLAPPRSAWLDD